MNNLPKSTDFNKRIPKIKFYENLNINTKLKRKFIDEIDSIIWRNKISEETVNIKRGKTVNEIQVLLIELSKKELDKSVLLQIDSEIPYHILFILKYKEEYRACIGYKEEQSGKTPFKVSEYYCTDWKTNNNLKIRISGLDLNSVYENLVKDIAGDKLNTQKHESVSDSIEREKQIKSLEKEIERLVSRRRREKHLSRQMEINNKIRELKQDLMKMSL